MSLNEVSKDHRFISYRKMQAEAAHNLQSLLDQSALPHITAQVCFMVNILNKTFSSTPVFYTDNKKHLARAVGNQF